MKDRKIVGGCGLVLMNKPDHTTVPTKHSISHLAYSITGQESIGSVINLAYIVVARARAFVVNE